MPDSITCPRCSKTSYHPEDKRWGWCANCNAYTSDPAAPQTVAGVRQCFLILTATGHPCGGTLIDSGIPDMDVCLRCKTWMSR